MSAEVWLPVVGYEFLYEVSDLGRVRSLVMPTCVGRKPRKTPLLLKLRSPRDDKYLTATLLGRTHYVHVLVAEAFIGPRPTPGSECCHGDRNPGHNALSNLRWDTAAANQQERVKDGTHVRALRHPLGKLSDAKVLEIKRRLDAGETGKDLASEYSVSRALISGFRTNKFRKWLGV